ncbi:MAG: FHA domain-containing protein [Myxococcota bacterium]
MSTWLAAWRNRENREVHRPVIELLVVAGADAGAQFTIEGDEVLLGRGQPSSGQTDSVRLDDKSISRRQAWIRAETNGYVIEHVATAANPTLVNGIEIRSVRLDVGDRIDMGRVSIDVRVRAGMNLSGLTEIMEVAALESTVTGSDLDGTTELASPDAETASPLHAGALPAASPSLSASSRSPSPSPVSSPSAVPQCSPAAFPPGAAKEVSEEVTEIRPMDVAIGELSILRGAEDAPVTRFPIFMAPLRIGRGESADVQIAELGVSRMHAEIEMAGRALVLRQLSQTNPTLVNGFPVLDEVELADGDEIQLADQVVLGVQLSVGTASVSAGSGGAEGATSAVTSRLASPSTSGLMERMSNKIDLDRKIEAFNMMGSFLDVDVVASRKMKQYDEKAEHIIVSFERFRAYVGGICEEWNGQVLNSNGDELMCFFESAEAAVCAGGTILSRLTDFNRDLNLLSQDFRFRLGAHTGVSLVDLDAGIAYSEVLDTAGHIQKMAEPNSMLISQVTLEALPNSGALPVEAAGELTGESGPLYRFTRPLSSVDFEDPSQA